MYDSLPHGCVVVAHVDKHEGNQMETWPAVSWREKVETAVADITRADTKGGRREGEVVKRGVCESNINYALFETLYVFVRSVSV